MFYAGYPRWVYCLATYSLSCRGRFPDTGIIWNMLLIMFHFLWKNHFTCIALKYVTLCRNLLWQWCLKSTKPRLFSTHLFPLARYVCFTFFGNIIFRPFSIYVFDSLFYMKLTYICYFICRPLVRPRCMKSTKPVAHLWWASKYVYVGHFLCTFVYISFSNLVLEETQIGDPLPPKVHVYLLTLAYI